MLARSAKAKVLRRSGFLNIKLFQGSVYSVLHKQERPASNVPKRRWENSNPNLPTHFNFFKDVVKKWAEKETTIGENGTLAVHHVHESGRETKWNFRELVLRTEKTAGILKRYGLEEKDKMFILLPRVPEWWVVNLAVIQLGIVTYSGTTQLRAHDIVYRLNSFQPQCVIANYECATRVDEATKESYNPKIKILCSEDGRARKGWLDFNKLYEESVPCSEVANTKTKDVMYIFFTSGTSGFPKMVVQSHGMAYKFQSYLEWWTYLEPGYVLWNVADTGWAKTAWASFFYPWTFGACVFIYHSHKFDAKSTANILQNYPITSFCAPPTVYKMLLNLDLSSFKFRHLRQCSSAGESLTEAVVKAWKRHTGLHIDSVYGQSESPLMCSTHPCTVKKPGSLGIPHKDIELAILNKAGNVVGIGEEGDIAIKLKPYYPVGLFLEYWNNPQKTEEAFRGDYYITGDRGYKDEDGHFWFVGRSDDVISSSGYRIGPFEIEDALQHHPAVAESAVVGAPDPIRGEIVKAFVVLKEEFADADHTEMASTLRNHVIQLTAPYKYPREIEFVKELPKTDSGKIQRFKLRAKAYSTK